MVVSWMASTKAFLFDFDGTLARLNIDFKSFAWKSWLWPRTSDLRSPS